MGEIADLMINGDICELCNCELGKGNGYPRRCSACGGESDPEEHESESHRAIEEPRRIEYALDQLKGYKVDKKGNSRLDIFLKQGRISIWPYTGWFVGRKPLGKVKGRGIAKLMAELEKLNGGETSL